MRQIIATDEIGYDPLVEYVDAETFARIYMIVMEYKSLHPQRSLTPRAADQSEQSVGFCECETHGSEYLRDDKWVCAYCHRPLPERSAGG